MPSTYSAELVSLEGADAIAFAQAQFSSNVTSLADGHWQFSAWLDAQGRVRALFHLVRLAPERLWLLLRGGDAQEMAGELQRFVFRSEVKVQALPTRPLGTGDAMPLHTVIEGPGTLALGCGSHGLQLATSSDDGWRLMQLRAGWPWLPPGTRGEMLPVWLGLGALGATALDKGCYPGQEIVARMHYRGGSKWHLRRVRLSRPLQPGEQLQIDGRVVIRLLDVVVTGPGAEALAAVHEDLRARIGSGVEARNGEERLMVQATEEAVPAQG